MNMYHLASMKGSQKVSKEWRWIIRILVSKSTEWQSTWSPPHIIHTPGLITWITKPYTELLHHGVVKKLPYISNNQITQAFALASPNRESHNENANGRTHNQILSFEWVSRVSCTLELNPFQNPKYIGRDGSPRCCKLILFESLIYLPDELIPS